MIPVYRSAIAALLTAPEPPRDWTRLRPGLVRAAATAAIIASAIVLVRILA